jgi:hypothetical protein
LTLVTIGEMSHLNLIKTDFEELEKRILPRFPLTYLTFKTDSFATTFEVKDVSWSGMQLSLKNSEHIISRGQILHGMVHWQGEAQKISVEVKWFTQNRIGCEFIDKSHDIKKFFSYANFAHKLKPIHLMETELPPKLKIWLRSDGPAELFVWQNTDGSWQSFQIILMENFIEWVDGIGLRTGRVMSKRDVDTPLINEDEFVFNLDQGISSQVMTVMTQFVENIPDSLLKEEEVQFLLRKISY